MLIISGGTYRRNIIDKINFRLDVLEIYVTLNLGGLGYVPKDYGIPSRFRVSIPFNIWQIFISLMNSDKYILLVAIARMM